MIDVPLPEEGGPPPSRAEYRARQEGYARTAREIVTGVEVSPRRQDKIIAAVVRRDPTLILADAVTLHPDERNSFLERSAQDAQNPITNDDYEAALSRTPIAIRIPADDENLRHKMTRFAGDETQQRRMRRIIAATTHGGLDHPNDVDARALLTFVTDSFPTAVAFEQHLPQLVAMIEEEKLGINNYREAIQAVGLELYGSQWTYLQQGRLAEAEGRRLHPTTAVEPDEPGPPGPPDAGAGAASVEVVRRNSFETLVDTFPPAVLLEPDPRVFDQTAQQTLADQRFAALMHSTDAVHDDRLLDVAREAAYARKDRNRDARGRDIRYTAAIMDTVDPVIGIRLLNGLLQTTKRSPGGIADVIDLPRLRELAATQATQGVGLLNLNENQADPLRWANHAINTIGTETGIQFVSPSPEPWVLAQLYVGIANEVQRRGTHTLTDQHVADIAMQFLTDSVIEQHEHHIETILKNRIARQEQATAAADENRVVDEHIAGDVGLQKAREVINRHLPRPWRRRGRND